MKFHPKLAPVQRAVLKSAIDRFKLGQQPVIGLRYEGGSKRRKAGIDYVSIPGLAEDAHIGPLVRTSEEKIFLRDIARSDGENSGLTSIRIEAILEFAIACWRDAPVERHLKVTHPTYERTRSGEIKKRTS